LLVLDCVGLWHVLDRSLWGVDLWFWGDCLMMLFGCGSRAFWGYAMSCARWFFIRPSFAAASPSRILACSLRTHALCLFYVASSFASAACFFIGAT
jgi:hypothetical protein